jgi:hypothetical protein
VKVNEFCFKTKFCQFVELPLPFFYLLPDSSPHFQLFPQLEPPSTVDWLMLSLGKELSLHRLSFFDVQSAPHFFANASLDPQHLDV